METLPYRCRACGEEFGAPFDFEIDCPACDAGPVYHETNVEQLWDVGDFVPVGLETAKVIEVWRDTEHIYYKVRDTKTDREATFTQEDIKHGRTTF